MTSLRVTGTFLVLFCVFMLLAHRAAFDRLKDSVAGLVAILGALLLCGLVVSAMITIWTCCS